MDLHIKVDAFVALDTEIVRSRVSAEIFGIDGHGMMHSILGYGSRSLGGWDRIRVLRGVK